MMSYYESTFELSIVMVVNYPAHVIVICVAVTSLTNNHPVR